MFSYYALLRIAGPAIVEGRGSVQVRSGACLHARRALAAEPQRLLDALAAEAVAAGRGRSRGDTGECVEADRALGSLRSGKPALALHFPADAVSVSAPSSRNSLIVDK